MLNIRNTNAAWLRRYEIMLVEAIKCYRERGLRPFFLNHEGVEDGALISRVNGILDEPIPVIAESDPLAVKGIIGVCEAVFSSRFHGCISAMSQGIACVGTSWSHKYVELYDQYAASSLLLQPENTYEDLKRIIDLSLDKDSKLHGRIANQAMILKSDSLSMWQRFHVIVLRYSGLRDS
jgi:colanic acid/amylovoran biosynthesis protein